MDGPGTTREGWMDQRRANVGVPEGGRGVEATPGPRRRRRGGRRWRPLRRITCAVNGVQREAEVEPRQLLVYFLRETLGLTGTNVGCDTSSCGACTVMVDGETVKSCTMLTVQADGSEITTIEGLTAN